MDVIASASRWEGFNLGLAEGQWYGRPAVAYAVGAHPEQDVARLAAIDRELLHHLFVRPMPAEHRDKGAVDFGRQVVFSRELCDHWIEFTVLRRR